jgi:hypothetical protein
VTDDDSGVGTATAQITVVDDKGAIATAIQELTTLADDPNIAAALSKLNGALEKLEEDKYLTFRRYISNPKHFNPFTYLTSNIL